MRRWLAVAAARAGRVARGLWPDRNPLRRTVDRVEAVLVAGLAVAFLAGVPLAPVAAWHAAYGYGARCPRPAGGLAPGAGGGAGHRFNLRIHRGRTDGAGPVDRPWRGAAHRYSSRAGRYAGGQHSEGLDRRGRPAGPPLRASQVKGEAALAAVLAPVVLGEMLLLAGQLAQYLLGRRRLAAWDAEWRATGPQWSRR